MNKLRQMTLFMNIVEAGSITGAAEKLGLSKSVLSQHLKQLELDLSTTLLKRTTRRQCLTHAGERFYKHCCEMHSLAESAWDEVLEQQDMPAGTLTITAPHALMDVIVIPALAHTFAEYRDVSLNLICQDTQMDLMTHNIDLAIRVGESTASNYRQKRIGTFSDILCGKKGKILSLRNTPYIANHWQPKQISHLINGENVSFEAKHHTNTIHQTIALIRSGLGIGIVPEILQRHHPELASLQTLAHSNIYALHPFSTAVPIAVTMAINSITGALAKPQTQTNNKDCSLLT